MTLAIRTRSPPELKNLARLLPRSHSTGPTFLSPAASAGTGAARQYLPVPTRPCSGPAPPTPSKAPGSRKPSSDRAAVGAAGQRLRSTPEAGGGRNEGTSKQALSVLLTHWPVPPQAPGTQLSTQFQTGHTCAKLPAQPNRKQAVMGPPLTVLSYSPALFCSAFLPPTASSAILPSPR